MIWKMHQSLWLISLLRIRNSIHPLKFVIMNFHKIVKIVTGILGVLGIVFLFMVIGSGDEEVKAAAPSKESKPVENVKTEKGTKE